MIKSKITIEIPEMSIGDYIIFETNINNTIKTFRVDWVAQDLGNTIISFYNILHESFQIFPIPFYNPIEYSNRLSLIDNLSTLEITRVGNIINIQSNVEGLNFQNENSNNLNVVFLVDNQIEVSDPLTIDSYSFTQDNNNPCSNINISISTSKIADEILSPYVEANNTNNPINFSYLRGQILTFTVKDSQTGVLTTKNIRTPQMLLENDIIIEQISNNLGNSINVIYSNSSNINLDLGLQYSIDGISFSSSNVFNVSEGPITVYVKDSYGCQVTKSINFVDTTTKIPYIYIPKTNSIRFAEKVQWDNLMTFKNDDNTLSYESLNDLSLSVSQLFQVNDSPITQLRTNYDNVDVEIISETNSVINVSKVREYLNLKDSRDCIIYDRGYGEAGIYFSSGSIYDYDSENKIGDFTLNGSLPTWYKVGTSIFIEGIGAVEIKAIVFNEALNAEVAVVDYNYNQSQTFTKVKSIYDLRAFNLFEFTSNFSQHNNKCVQVVITFSDPKLPTKIYHSEFLQIKEVHPECLQIEYYNEYNGDIYYETGIKNLIRVPVNDIVDSPTTEAEIHTGDTNISLIESEYYEGDEFTFLPLSKELSKKLELALSHKFVIINGIGYKRAENPEKEKQGRSNLYVVKAKMIKSGSAFINNSGIILQEENTSITIPSIINIGNGQYVVI
ncbi:hypothetical protein BTO06_09775 [Tenacibaculum sp. SZ-18]|uniref:hypothetical protein n=1 Tax=Tenacibaculum sp. SZ-18 TaxID=754423 RepID=UPI000C2CECD3|nr:hypothetical protein [Tenacibaculum sp. SZ-18]AUC15408.1 hypothetical protein BTO06_09775 [Tenacibaculum sp. SZ-18]